MAPGRCVRRSALGVAMTLKYLGSSPCKPLTKPRPCAGQEGIFAVGFLPAAPAWIAKDVDVGRPDVEAFVDVAPSWRMA